MAEAGVTRQPTQVVGDIDAHGFPFPFLFLGKFLCFFEALIPCALESLYIHF